MPNLVVPNGLLFYIPLSAMALQFLIRHCRWDERFGSRVLLKFHRQCHASILLVCADPQFLHAWAKFCGYKRALLLFRSPFRDGFPVSHTLLPLGRTVRLEGSIEFSPPSRHAVRWLRHTTAAFRTRCTVTSSSTSDVSELILALAGKQPRRLVNEINAQTSAEEGVKL